MRPYRLQVLLAIAGAMLIGFKIAGVIHFSWGILLIPFYFCIAPVVVAAIAFFIIELVAVVNERIR